MARGPSSNIVRPRQNGRRSPFLIFGKISSWPSVIVPGVSRSLRKIRIFAVRACNLARSHLRYSIVIQTLGKCLKEMNALSVYVGDLEMPSFPPVEFFEEGYSVAQEYIVVAFVQVEVDSAEPGPSAIATDTIYGMLANMVEEPLELTVASGRFPTSRRSSTNNAGVAPPIDVGNGTPASWALVGTSWFGRWRIGRPPVNRVSVARIQLAEESAGTSPVYFLRATWS